MGSQTRKARQADAGRTLAFGDGAEAMAVQVGDDYRAGLRRAGNVGIALGLVIGFGFGSSLGYALALWRGVLS